MKKTALILSLICSGLVVVGLGALTIMNVFSNPNKPDPADKVAYESLNKRNNVGSEEQPYYIYDTESFEGLLSEYGSETKPIREVIKEALMVPEMVDAIDEETGDVIIDEETGEPKQVEKRDEEGNIVYVPKYDENDNIVMVDKLDESGNAEYKDIGGTEYNHFEICQDIDFAEVEYSILFNKGTAFSGIIDGKGHKVKNITIKVDKKFFVENIFTVDKANRSYAHIGIFGDLNGAIIKNVDFENITIEVDDEVYDYINDDIYRELGTSIVEFTVGAVAASSVDSEISVNLTANIHADAYGVWEEGQNIGKNCVGGVVGYAENTVIYNVNAEEKRNAVVEDENSEQASEPEQTEANDEQTDAEDKTDAEDDSTDKTEKVEENNVQLKNVINVTFTADSGTKNYYLGGIAGYSFNSIIKDFELTANVSASAKAKTNFVGDVTWIGGVVGYARTSNIGCDVTEDSDIVTFTVTQTEEERLSGHIVDIEEGKYNMIGGIVSIIRANSSSEKTVISNIKTTSNVKMDCLFGGAVFQVKTTDTTTNDADYVTFKNLTLYSNVDVLKAFGVGAYLKHTTISYTEDYIPSKTTNINNEQMNYNIALLGKITLSSSSEKFFAGAICSNSISADVAFILKDVRFITSTALYNEFTLTDKTRMSTTTSEAYRFGESHYVA